MRDIYQQKDKVVQSASRKSSNVVGVQDAEKVMLLKQQQQSTQPEQQQQPQQSDNDNVSVSTPIPPPRKESATSLGKESSALPKDKPLRPIKPSGLSVVQSVADQPQQSSQSVQQSSTAAQSESNDITVVSKVSSIKASFMKDSNDISLQKPRSLNNVSRPSGSRIASMVNLYEPTAALTPQSQSKSDQANAVEQPQVSSTKQEDFTPTDVKVEQRDVPPVLPPRQRSAKANNETSEKTELLGNVQQVIEAIGSDNVRDKHEVAVLSKSDPELQALSASNGYVNKLAEILAPVVKNVHEQKAPHLNQSGTVKTVTESAVTLPEIRSPTQYSSSRLITAVSPDSEKKTFLDDGTVVMSSLPSAHSHDNVPSISSHNDEDLSSSISSLSTHSKNQKGVNTQYVHPLRANSDREKSRMDFSNTFRRKKNVKSVIVENSSNNSLASVKTNGGRYQEQQRPKWYDLILDEVERERLLSSMNKDDKTRQEVSYEILSTEQDYINDLKLIVETYVKPIRDRKVKIPFELADLFSNIEQILPVNEAFLQELKHCRKDYLLEGVGNAFLAVADYFKLYTMYCGLHAKAMDSLQKALKADMPIKTFLKEVYSRQEFGGLNLESFLLKPVQRICKYPLFLRELQKATPDDHKDKSRLEKASAKIDDIVAVVNERTKHLESMMLTIEAIKKIKGGAELMNPTRKILAESWCQVKTSNMENGIDQTRKCQVFLFNDLLVFTKPPSMISRDKNVVLSSFSTDHLTWLDVVGEDVLQNSLMLIDSVTLDVYQLIFLQQADKERWIDVFEEAQIQPEQAQSYDALMSKIHAKSQHQQQLFGTERNEANSQRTSALVEESSNIPSLEHRRREQAGLVLATITGADQEPNVPIDISSSFKEDPLLESILKPLYSLSFVDTNFVIHTGSDGDEDDITSTSKVTSVLSNTKSSIAQ
ncbi:hypothetical protein MIR68_011894 [Amoeboaphelidium protococcarum]|nr:hypothetical protein MIR68_011894 [Amoeboaphelidium protococcarum]